MKKVDKYYKYRSLNSSGTLSLLLRNEIFLASPDRLNDPFDCRIYVRFEDCTENEILSMFSNQAKMMNPNIDNERADELARQQFRDNNHKSDFFINHMRGLFYESLNSKFGMASFSTIRNNVLMWSHYADSHKGICIGLDTDQLALWMEQKHHEGVEIRPVEVKYSTKMPYLNPCKHPDAEIIYKSITSKSSNWRYEKEFRIIGYGIPNQAFELPQGCIVDVTMGALIPKSDEENLKSIVRGRKDKIKLYRSFMNNNGYGLKIKREDY